MVYLPLVQGHLKAWGNDPQFWLTLPTSQTHSLQKSVIFGIVIFNFPEKCSRTRTPRLSRRLLAVRLRYITGMHWPRGPGKTVEGLSNDFHIFITLSSSFHWFKINEFNNLFPVGLLAQSVRALHQYRRGQGLKSDKSLNFFKLSFHNCKKL